MQYFGYAVPVAKRKLLGLCILATCLAGCQNLFVSALPKAKGLPPLQALVVSTNQPLENLQQQVEIRWKDKSFSFLLSQEQDIQGKLHVVALTLSGQVLFELKYDGDKIETIQIDPALKALPLDYLMRDIWWATMPVSQVVQAIEPLQLELVEQEQTRTIFSKKEKNKIQLQVKMEQNYQVIDNLIVPYTIILTNTTQKFLQ